MATKEVLAYQELQKRKQKKSFAYFVNEFVTMFVKEGGDPIPFKLWKFQETAADIFQHKQKVIVLKARQMGMSWLAMAYVVWCVLNKKNFHVYITSIGLKEVNEQMERIRFIWYNLPDWLRGDVQLGGRGGKDNDSLITFSNGSAIHAIASTRSGGHGAAPGLYVLDEFARKDNDIMAWRAIKPSLGKKSQVLIISTSDGLSNLFADLWFGATKGDNEFTPVFFPATDHPEYTPEYIEEMRRDFAGDRQGFMEAFPLKPEDAFLASSRAIFDEARIREWKELIRSDSRKAPVGYDPIIGFLEEVNGGIDFVEDEGGQLMIWRHPLPGHRYTCGTDLAEGLTDGDWSVSAILDSETLEIVALYRGRIAPEDYSYPVKLLAKYYNNAWLVVEVNKNSELIMGDLKTNYPFLYCREYREKITDKPTLVPGFYMSGHNKQPLILQLRRSFSDESRPLKIYSDIILNEFSTFEELSNKKLGAAGTGKHDDCVIAVALAVEGLRTMPSIIAQAGRGIQSSMIDAFTQRGRVKRSWRSL